jgi:hypothetical protein
LQLALTMHLLLSSSTINLCESSALLRDEQIPASQTGLISFATTRYELNWTEFSWTRHV